MKKISFEESRQMQIEILNAFDSFCNEHNLRYMLSYGTLLGAVRHKGFIPWDDDIDICMLIEDYKKLVAILNEHRCNVIDGRYRVAGPLIDDDIPYHQDFAKIYDIRTTATKSTLKSSLGFHEGIFIDVFFVTGLPDNTNEREEIVTKLRYAHSMLYWATRKVTFSDFTPAHPRTSLRNFTEWVQSHRKPYQEWLDDFSDCLVALPDAKESAFATEIVIYLCKKTDNYLCNPWLPQVMLEFENRLYPGPADYDTILTRDYGDYMQLPPEKQRKPSHDQDYFLLD